MLRLFLLVFLVVFGRAGWADECRPDVVELRGPWGQARFTVELAVTAQEKQQGLMFREHLPASQGMLFVYDRPGAPSFWMKNTLIPLDMLFITPAGEVQHVHAMAQPGDLTGINGGSGVQYVLEITGGLAARMGITPGSQMRSPVLDQSLALWSCESDEAGSAATDG